MMEQVRLNKELLLGIPDHDICVAADIDGSLASRQAD
jgi:hypothetical protein